LAADLARVLPHVVATEIGGDGGIAGEAERNTRQAFTHN
jgi:hypothetical protein